MAGRFHPYSDIGKLCASKKSGGRGLKLTTEI